MQNVGIPERWVRVIGGSFLAFIGLAYLLCGDFVYTGITGYCPLYNKLGFSTALRREH